MRKVKVLGDLELIDQGELDHKIIVIDADDPLASRLNSAADLPRVMPGVLEKLVEWLKMYKTTDGKEVNKLTSDAPTSAPDALKVIADCHESWATLKKTGPGDTGFWLK
jgi:inorganic pyrophosphatase